jgi:hypothetical protein
VISRGWVEESGISQTVQNRLEVPLGPFKLALITTFIPLVLLSIR